MTGDERAARPLSALELVARAAEQVPALTAEELEELADAVEDLTDAIAFTLETTQGDGPAEESGTAAPRTQ